MPTAGRRALDRDRLARALDLHTRGWSVRDIAAELGCTPARAAKLLGQAVAGLPAQEASELRATSELRLDRAAKTYGDLLDDPDSKVRADAARGIVAVEAQRARLLGTYLRPEKDL